MDAKSPGNPQFTTNEREHTGSGRDPEERPVQHPEQARERNLDKTLADSFPTSDPPSTIPDPVAAHARDDAQADFDDLIAVLPPGSWAVISEADMRVLGTGPTREEAVQNAGRDESRGIRVIRVPQDPDAPEQAA
jgi:hypothetical protein